MYFTYSVLLAMAAVALTPYWLAHGLRHGKYFANLRERLGLEFPGIARLGGRDSGAIWLHVVSVGEALSAVTLGNKLKERFPGRSLVVSTTTLTGQALARERMPFADGFLYFPLDWTWCVRRALSAVKPSLVIILETEIWPNFLREANRRGVPVLFVSGRISGRSFLRYKKWLRIAGWYLRPFLRRVLASPAAFSMQTESDAERIRALGASKERVTVSGNLKYDLDPAASTPLAEWLKAEAKRLGRSPVIVAGSVVATEEPLALIAFGTLQGEYPNGLLVLAPRKPERFAAAGEFIEESHRKFVRRSELSVPKPGETRAAASQNGRIPEDVTVVLLDSIGELASLYAIADGVFVGGSLVPSGGHNILEPAAFGKVAVFGPSMENFAEIASHFLQAGAAIQVENPEDAGGAWIELLRDPARAQRMGDAARNLVAGSRGATDRALAEATKHLESRSGTRA